MLTIVLLQILRCAFAIMHHFKDMAPRKIKEALVFSRYVDSMKMAVNHKYLGTICGWCWCFSCKRIG